MYADRLGAEEGPEGRLFCALFGQIPVFSEQEGSFDRIYSFRGEHGPG